jgi:CRP-like cAMP-binding protein
LSEFPTRSAKAGELIFTESEIPDCAFVVESGEVEISTRVDSIMRCIAVLGPSEVFGELGLLGDDLPGQASAVASADSVLIMVNRTTLQSQLDTVDPVGGKLLRACVRRLQHKVHAIESPTPMSVNPTAAVEIARLESALRAAIESDELRLFVHPIVDFRNQQIVGFESLVRWQHTWAGIVRPDLFIPLAERSGLIVPLGHWVCTRHIAQHCALIYSPTAPT